jgi:predicted aspartyl protease/Tfp pilus assembly protein PilF
MQPVSVRLTFAAVAAAALAAMTPGQGRADCRIQQIATFPVTMEGMAPTVTAKVNGAPLRFVLDSGAFYSVINPEVARRYKLPTQGTNAEMRGVGGATRLSIATVKIFELAQVPIHDLQFVVPDAMPAGMDGVLGANIVGFADMELDFANGVARMFQPKDCQGANLAYWNPADAVELKLTHSARQVRGDFNPSGQVTATGQLNGKPIQLMFDTGASRSVLSARAAARVGVTSSSPGAVRVSTSSGFGSRLVEVWQAPFAELSLGRETIRNISLQFADMGLNDVDLLLGADFFLSHRVYLANSQGKIYLTYNGGPVFRFDQPQPKTEPAVASTSPGAPPPAAAKPDGLDADALRRRAYASLARRDYAAALVDFNRALALNPADADALAGRARYYLAAGNRQAASADLDASLKSDPKNSDVLIQRAALRRRDEIQAIKADLDEAVRQKGPESDAALSAAEVYESHYLFAEAIPLYDAWLKRNGESPSAIAALNGRCWARAVLKVDLDKALADCNAALRRGAKVAEIIDSRALVRLNRGEIDLAITDYDAALRIDPNKSVSLYGRGVAKRRKGLTEAGQADIEAARRINPNIDDVAKRLGLAP